MSTEIAKPKQSVREWLGSDKLKTQITQALPKGVTLDRFLRALFTQVQRNPKLLTCTLDSLYSSAITCAQLGIEPDGRRAHLIPFNDTRSKAVICQLIIDWKGLVELILRSGQVSYIHADVVCANDVFEVDKGRIAKHMVDYKKGRGDVYAAYAMATMKDGTEKAEVMTLEEIEAIRKRSRAGTSGPWVTDTNEMRKKTVVRRLSKWLPLSAEDRRAIEADDDQFEAAKNVTGTAEVPDFELPEADPSELPAETE